MDLTFFYPTRTRKEIRRIERCCSGYIEKKYQKNDYLFKYVVNKRDGWFHIVQCIGRKKYMCKNIKKERYLHRHYIIPDYAYGLDICVIHLLGGSSEEHFLHTNINLPHKKYHVTTYKYK